jgi:hypothetical protein
MDVLHTRLLFQEVKSRFSIISTFNKELLKATAYLLLLFYFPNLGKAIKIPAKTVAQFKAGKALSEKVNKKK